MKKSRTSFIALACLGVAGSLQAAEPPRPENLTSRGRNDFVILEPNYQLVLEGLIDGKPASRVVTVTDQTRKFDGIETRTVESLDTLDGRTTRVVREYLAIDLSSHDVYTFGTDVAVYNDVNVSSREGSWRVGRDGAGFGLYLAAHPQAGDRFTRATAGPDKPATDKKPAVTGKLPAAAARVEITGLDDKVETPGGVYAGCLTLRETVAAARHESTTTKVFAPTVGLVAEGDLKLVKRGVGIVPRPQPPKKPLIAQAARDAMVAVGADPLAEFVWMQSINDPSVPPGERSDLIEDLNEEGFADPHHVTADELPLVLSRLELIEQLAPDAMDETNAAAFKEAYKDLVNIADRLMVTN